MVDMGKSHPAKTRNLSRLISNLSGGQILGTFFLLRSQPAITVCGRSKGLKISPLELKL